jgi:hypothetical protein
MGIKDNEILKLKKTVFERNKQYLHGEMKVEHSLTCGRTRKKTEFVF